MSSPTPNKGFTYPAHGGSVNAWDSPLNANFDELDLLLGNAYNVVCNSSIAGVVFNSTYCTASSTVAELNLLSSIANNLYYSITGTASAITNGNYFSINFPSGVGQFAIINDQTGGKECFSRVQGSGVYTGAFNGTTNLVVTDGATEWLIAPSVAAAFASGTSMLFMQAAAPSGWTQDTTQNDRLLRIVNDGTGTGTGGQWAVSGITIQNHTLSTGEMPSHNHGYNQSNSDNNQYQNGSKNANDGQSNQNTGNTGGGGGHNHGVSVDGTWRPNYQNVLRATKN